MKLFLNDAESPFARCFIEVANDKGHSIIAVRQKISDENKDVQLSRAHSPFILTWNLASIFSIRLVLRQCSFIWGNETPSTYLFLLQSSMISAALFRDKPHEIHQKIEEQLYGQLILLRELETQRAKFVGNIEENSRIVFIVLEENNPVELLGGCIYSALHYSFQHMLSNSDDPNIFGFYSQNNNYEAFSEFILNQLEKRPERHIGKWMNFKEFWFLPSNGINFINLWK